MSSLFPFTNEEPAPPPPRPRAAPRAAGGSARSRRESRIDDLETRLERLSVICEAMWDLLSDEVGLGVEQLAGRVDDLTSSIEQDRRPPGRLRNGAAASRCPECDSAMPVGSRACLFCTARSSGDPVEELGDDAADSTADDGGDAPADDAAETDTDTDTDTDGDGDDEG